MFVLVVKWKLKRNCSCVISVLVIPCISVNYAVSNKGKLFVLNNVMGLGIFIYHQTNTLKTKNKSLQDRMILQIYLLMDLSRSNIKVICVFGFGPLNSTNESNFNLNYFLTLQGQYIVVWVELSCRNETLNTAWLWNRIRPRKVFWLFHGIKPTKLIHVKLCHGGQCVWFHCPNATEIAISNQLWS